MCIKDGEERGFTAEEFKTAQADGWEKQYQYKIGKKKVYMVPSEAEAQGYERASKYPKCTRYGRQNPTYERWNDVIMLDSWRTCWAGAANRALEAIGSKERIAPRSHALRGLDEQPTIHEGVTARALEKKGIISERCELNRQIRKDNALLHRLKEMVAEMIRKIRGSVNDMAERIDLAWMYMVESQYHLIQIQNEKQDILNDLRPVLEDYNQYSQIQAQIKKLTAQREKLIAQRKATPILQIRRRNELAADIESLAQQIEGRKRNTENLLKARRYPSEKEMQEVGRRIHAGKEKLAELAQREKQHSLALQRNQRDFRRWTQTVRKEARDAVSEKLTSVRDDSVDCIARKLKTQYGSEYKSYILQGAIQDTDRWCAAPEVPEHDPNERKSIRAFLEREFEVAKQRNHKKRNINEIDER